MDALEMTAEEAADEQVAAVLGRLVGDFAGTAGVVLTALLMRFGGNTIRGSNPRSSALTQRFCPEMSVRAGC